MISFEPEPKIASTLSWSPAFAASMSALPASSGEANVLWLAAAAAAVAAVPDFAQETRGIRKTKSNAKVAGAMVRRTWCGIFDLQEPTDRRSNSQFHRPD